MSLASWIRRFLAAILPGRSTNTEVFLDEKRFRFELSRERMRVDRNHSPLAVLTIELPADRSAAADYDFLGRLLMRRLRITDTFGFLSDQRVGVLLPDTSKSGAWKVADDLCSVYPVGHDRPSCDVIVYPDEAPRREGAPREHSKDAAPSAIDALLAQATPTWKRAIDVAGASFGLTLLAPLVVLICVAIKLSSRGPAFYSQEREGLGGRRFRIQKLRTMRLNAEDLQADLREYSEQDGPAFKMRDDPRITWIGRWLRTLSLDELPQLWNVLRGEMSLVGPRPLPTAESLQCEPWQRQRLWVTPGMTCTWQVWGRNIVPFDEWMRMDANYVRSRTPLHDLKLLAITAPALVLGRGPR
jgi:lipopolysaccharide/colanic/teichoic acid biosynthesis glycosyltransferase